MNNRTLLSIAASLSLLACEADKGTALQDSLTPANTVDVVSNLDLGESVIPFPIICCFREQPMAR